MGLTTASRQKATKAVLAPGTTYYASLGTAAGSTHELSGITRKSFTVATPTSTGQERNVAAIALTMPSTAKVPYVQVWTALTGGTMLWTGPSGLGTATIPSGSTVTYPIHDLVAKVT